MPHYGDFEYSQLGSRIIIDKYTGSAKSVDIPAQIDDVPVTSIAGEAFFCCFSPTSITIPNSVTSIGDMAFSLCSSLTSITVPNSVTSIGDMAFAHCSSLTNITIPDSITFIGYMVFDDCEALTTIDFPRSLINVAGKDDSITRFLKENTYKIRYCGLQSDSKKIIETLKNDVDVSESILNLIEQIETLSSSKKHINENNFITKIFNDIEVSYRKQKELSINPVVNLITLINSLSNKKMDNALLYAQKSYKNIANINLQIEIALKKLIILLKSPYVISPQQIQSFRERLYKAYGDLSGVYFAHTNEKASTKINGAINAFAQKARNENVIFVLDTTLFGSATNGLLVTDKNIYMKDFLEYKKSLPLEQVKKVDIVKDNLIINNEYKLSVVGVNFRLTDMLEEIRNFF